MILLGTKNYALGNAFQFVKNDFPFPKNCFDYFLDFSPENKNMQINFYGKSVKK